MQYSLTYSMITGQGQTAFTGCDEALARYHSLRLAGASGIVVHDRALHIVSLTELVAMIVPPPSLERIV
jgi:hypothetical protein